MTMAKSYLFLAILCSGCVASSVLDRDVEDPQHEEPGEADAILAAAAAWTPGKAVPEELLEYRESDTCVGMPTDTGALYDSIYNVPLLLEVVRRADDRVAEVALERALVLDGPAKIFGAVGDARRAAARASEPAVWVSASVQLDDADKHPGRAQAIMEELMQRVEDGAAFEDAYRELFDQHATLVNRGPFVLSEGHPTAMPLRNIEVPAEHVRTLLASREGDLVLMKEPTPHHGGRWVLYQVEELYTP
jgi:hypothetical protein